METLIYLLFVAASHRVITFFVSGGVAGLLILLGARLKRLRVTAPLAGLLVSAAFSNILVSHLWLTPLIGRYGEDGTAVVVNQRATSVTHNRRAVVAYDALLRTREGETVEIEFRTDSFNVRPKPSQGYVYPGLGQEFTARYLPSHPESFLIVSDDDSVYARSLRCGAIGSEMSEAQRRYEFDKASPAFRERYAAALLHFARSCAPSRQIADFYEKQATDLAELTP